MDKQHRGVIWTNHALNRLRKRGISQSDAWATWHRPDQSRYAKSKNAWIYYRRVGTERIEVVARKNPQNQWIILSVWSRSLSQGDQDLSRLRSLWQRILKAFLP